MRKLFLLLSISSLVLAEDKIGFVYEVVRHGARAPLSEDPGKFQVGRGLLTASGMRQRLLVGMINRQRYVDEFGILDQTYNPKQIYMQSTDVHRTIQSGYAELMGLYPPGSGSQQLTDGQLKSLHSKKGMPPITIRKQGHQNDGLGSQSIIDGYVQIPVYNYISDNPNDFDDCPYSDDQGNYYWKYKQEIFDDVSSYILPIVREPLGKSQNWTDEKIQNMTFHKAYSISDIIKGEIFEGVPHTYHFTNEQWYYSRQTQKWALILPTLDENRVIEYTKDMKLPLAAMQSRVNNILANGDQRDDLKFVINSAHDDQISNMWYWLNPVNYEIDDVPYAASFIFELHYDSDCLETTKNETCFSVHVQHQGNPIQFETCLTNNAKSGSKSQLCTYADFKTYMASISSSGDVYALCDQKFVPPSR